MSPDLLAKIRNGVEAVLESDKSAEFFKVNGCERMKATPSQFSEIIAADYRHWDDVSKAVGIEWNSTIAANAVGSCDVLYSAILKNAG
jgi:tripartite-type tricarboxylate transporter receptor subunit TctC